jgi:hypothetical protein|tara:strand:+ start:580 stop:1152 length:573 start_codon:yes stop_codon:yes gene_type:complete
MTKWIIIVAIFLSGLYLSLTYSSKNIGEGFNDDKPRCPDILIQKGSELHLLNSKTAKIPGINPIKFNNLEEYTEFIDWQNAVGINCPVLFFQKGYDAQGESVYKINDNPYNNEPILPVYNQMNPTLSPLLDANTNGGSKIPHAYDDDNQYVGQYNKLDLEHDKKYGKANLNAMHTNWVGEEFSKNVFPKK